MNPLLEGVLPRRVAAWLIDLALIAVLTAIAWVILFLFGLLTLGLGFPLLGLLPVIPFIYHVAFIAGRRAATPGQALMDLATCRDIDLGPPTLVQAVLFTVGMYLTIAAGFVLFAVALVTVRNRALHDILSGLTIVRARALTRAAVSMNVGGRTMPG